MASYMTPAEVRARFTDLPDQPYTDVMLADLISDFEQAVEAPHAHNVAYTPRVVTGETHQVGSGQRGLVLDHQMIDTTADFTVNGDVITAPDLDAKAGILLSGFSTPKVTVGYTHGHTTTPTAVIRACALYVWHEAKAMRNPNTGNAFMSSNDAGIVERESTADPKSGRITGWMDVDRILSGQTARRDVGIA